MNDVMVIPSGSFDSIGPCWCRPVYSNGHPASVVIKCICGYMSGIAKHKITPDGTVTASYFDASEKEHPNGRIGGCGWHMWIKLDNYDGCPS